ncbi:MAG: hypothetical protein LBO00_04920, partial [Zoogloeaceae bacterium]|nr:hypothetical protein [Zoogloeaceae bacterium]
MVNTQVFQTFRGKALPQANTINAEHTAAYATDDILLAGLIANSRHPDVYEIVGPSLSSENYAIM